MHYTYYSKSGEEVMQRHDTDLQGIRIGTLHDAKVLNAHDCGLEHARARDLSAFCHRAATPCCM